MKLKHKVKYACGHTSFPIIEAPPGTLKMLLGRLMDLDCKACRVANAVFGS
jgi:hypothetical protein